jgi:hypothetical protein
MVTLRPGRRGASTLGCLVSVALFAAALYYGIHIGGMYWRYYQLLDDMRQQARFAGSVTDDAIQTHLAAQADSLLGYAPKFRIVRGGRPNHVAIDTQYSETVDLPLLKRTFVFRPHAEEPL